MGFLRNIRRGVNQAGRQIGHAAQGVYNAAKPFGQALASAAPTIGTVAGGMLGGPAGAAIGGQLGGMASQAASGNMTARQAGAMAGGMFGGPAGAQIGGQLGNFAGQAAAGKMTNRQAIGQLGGIASNAYSAYQGSQSPMGYQPVGQQQPAGAYPYARGGHVGLREMIDQLRALKSYADGGYVEDGDGSYYDEEGYGDEGGYEQGFPGYDQGGMVGAIQNGVNRFSQMNPMNGIKPNFGAGRGMTGGMGGIVNPMSRYI